MAEKNPLLLIEENKVKTVAAETGCFDTFVGYQTANRKITHQHLNRDQTYTLE